MGLGVGGIYFLLNNQQLISKTEKKFNIFEQALYNAKVFIYAGNVHIYCLSLFGERLKTWFHSIKS